MASLPCYLLLSGAMSHFQLRCSIGISQNSLSISWARHWPMPPMSLLQQRSAAGMLGTLALVVSPSQFPSTTRTSLYQSFSWSIRSVILEIWPWLEEVAGIGTSPRCVKHAKLIMIRMEVRVRLQRLTVWQIRISFSKGDKGNFGNKSRYQGWILVQGWLGSEIGLLPDLTLV